MAMLPRTLATADAMLCTAPASYLHALSLLWGPMCLPLGHMFSNLPNTSNIWEAHNAKGFIPPHILQHLLLISNLAGDIIYCAFSAIPH